ncbi:MAG: pimeloyl-ACP methyl ester carboxylesterase [Psychroserpens sp.]|jgi:pimeloyl-ACP methyl ester carboxylesterase|uniref:alpha/beta hydrolase family protein n=1 Tax=Psychroserpens sp. TaxID=2020870 RepID=UPI0039E25554
MNYYLNILLICFSFTTNSQELSYSTQDIAINNLIDGTLLTPNDGDKPRLAVIIADSGPTDRDGNQNFLRNNSLKKLAEALTNIGIATFRYDKRIVKQIRKNNVDPNIKFDDFVTDAISVVDYFKKDKTYSSIYVIGHSQGSLIGMLASKDRADGFISLGGSGQSIDEVITEQIGAMDPSLIDATKKAFESLKAGKTTTDYPPPLAPVFRADVQPFIMNWMQYNPQKVIKSLDIPILIINGTNDLQVSVDEAQLLKVASKDSEINIIEKMNHVLFIIEGDQLVNSKSYNESSRKISEELISIISSFILK